MPQPQWTAIGAVAPVLVLIVSGGLFRSLRARDIVYKRYSADRQAARAAVEGEAIIPALVALMGDVISRSIDDGVGLTETLQQTHFRPALARLSECYTDLQLIDRLPRTIARLIRWQGVAIGIGVASAVEILTPYCVSPLMLPAPATIAGYTLVTLSVACTLALAVGEGRRRDRLVTVFQKYDDFQGID